VAPAAVGGQTVEEEEFLFPHGGEDKNPVQLVGPVDWY
jgi:hypothetical protein